jgi:hypothetical protein
MIEAQLGRRRHPGVRTALTTVATLALAAFAAGCGSANDDEDVVVDGSTGPTAAASAPATANPPTAACPLVDSQLLTSQFTAAAPKLDEKDPVKGAGGVTTYSCDVTDNGELFLTVGVAVGPTSGTPEANVNAVLEGVPGEPVSGVGQAGAFGAKDGVGTVAGVKTIGGKYALLFVYGSADDKEHLIKVAQSASGRL